MDKKKIEQRVRFMGQPGQIYNIGRKSFAHNVWKVVTDEELAHILGDPAVCARFDFNPLPSSDLSESVTEVKSKKTRKSKKKEDD
jgi:hypothetical protein